MIKSIEELFEGFIIYRIAEAMTARTLDVTRSNLSLFGSWLANENINSSDQMDLNLSLRYIAYLRGREKMKSGKGKLSKGTIRKHIDLIKSLGKYMVLTGAGVDIGDGLKKPAPSQRIIVSLTPNQIIILFDSLSYMKSFARRLMYRALFTLILDTGLRIHEALNLGPDLVDYSTMYINVIGKNDKQRRVPFGPETEKVLKSLPNGEKYFPVRDSAVRGVLRTIKRHNQDTFKDVRLSPHTLRHTFARQWVVSGGDIYSLKEILGHTDIKMTEKYVFMDEHDISKKHGMHSVINIISDNSFGIPTDKVH